MVGYDTGMILCESSIQDDFTNFITEKSKVGGYNKSNTLYNNNY